MKEHGRAAFLTQPAPELLPHVRWLLLLFTVAVSIDVLTLLYPGSAGHSAIWLLVLIDLVALAGSGYCLTQMLRVHEHAIASQARLTEQIELREARFRALVQNTSDIVVILDATGQVVYRSPGAERADMLPPQVLTGSSAFEFIHPEDVPRARAFLQEIFQTPRVDLTRDLKLRRADGSWRDFEVVAINLIDEPAVAGIVVTCRDITERKLAELALRASEARNRALVDAIPDMMFRISRGGIYLDFKPSNRFTPLLPSEAFLGKRLSESLPTDLAERSLRAIEQALETGEPQILEYQLMHADELRDYEARIVVSAPDEVIAIVRDVTEPRRLEEELRETQKMESIGRLAGGIAHDFNNLLTVIGGCSELLLLDLPEDASDQRETVGEIQQAADRAAALTKQLLAFSRKQMLAPQVVQLNEVVAETSAMLRRVLGEHVEIVLDLESTLGTVRVDRGQIQQVVMNLAINGRDAMPAGGRLTIATRHARESGGTSHQDGGSAIGEFVVLTVSDTGSGIDAATRARIFEPFFTTKEWGKGTGLGLATVYGIVKQSGGNIVVESEPGRGTTFRVSLPRLPEPATPAAPPASSPPEPASAGTILLAEDEGGVRRLAKQILERSGYTVLEAGNGVEALELYERHSGRIDLLLTDVVMPLLNGPDLANQLTARQPELRVLFMSGYTDRAIDRTGELEPGLAFIGKPFSPPALVAKIREILTQDTPAGKRTSASSQC